ncbi:MAG: metal-sulfur cluster assembly factor [Deltaproteobacteria bacterium]|nr:metal-sulfur cluster assembly factor [Deltaproteobacteria bacterium]
MESQTVPAGKEEIVAALKTILDPEIYLDVWTLGLIYDLAVADGTLVVTMTFTSPACPAGPQIVDEIVQKTQALEGIGKTEVKVTFDPPWEPSQELRELLGLV